MKTFFRSSLTDLLTMLVTPGLASPLGTAFAYQRRLASDDSAAKGIYDLRFTIYDALTAGSVVGRALTNAATGVPNGLFAVTLDFGSVLGVRPNGGASDFISLAPAPAGSAESLCAVCGERQHCHHPRHSGERVPRNSPFAVSLRRWRCGVRFIGCPCREPGRRPNPCQLNQVTKTKNKQTKDQI